MKIIGYATVSGLFSKTVSITVRDADSLVATAPYSECNPDLSSMALNNNARRWVVGSNLKNVCRIKTSSTMQKSLT